MSRLPADPTEANIRHLVWDMALFGVFVGTTLNYLQVYVVRLGASSLLVAAVTYGPALISVFLQLPAGRLLSRPGWRKPWTVTTGVLYRMAYLLIALLPFVFTGALPELTVALLILQAVPAAMAITGFLSLMADAMPGPRIAQVIGWRMAAMGLTSTVSTLLAGRVLQWLAFPLNYQLLFIGGFVAAIISSWHVSRLVVPDRPMQPGSGINLRQDLGRILRHGRFAKYLIGVGALQLGFGMLAPLLPLFWVRGLGASDGQISIIVTTASAMLVVASLLMRRTVRRWGRERILAVGVLGFVLYPLLTSISPGVWWLIPWAALAGLFNSAIQVNLFDNLIAVTPAADRTRYIAVYNISTNLALVIGPLLSGLMASQPAGPVTGLRVAACVFLVSGAMFARWLPIQATRVA